jgi:hypothetical protein
MGRLDFWLADSVRSITGQFSFAGSDRRLPERAYEVAERRGHAERPVVSLAGSRKSGACSPSRGPVRLNSVRWLKRPFGRQHCQQKIDVVPALGSGGDCREANLIFAPRATRPRHVRFQAVRVRDQATP